MPGLDSLIQNKVGVGFPAAIQSKEAGAPSATFWSDGSTKNMGGAVTKKKKSRRNFYVTFPQGLTPFRLENWRREHKFYMCHIPGRSNNLQRERDVSYFLWWYWKSSNMLKVLFRKKNWKKKLKEVVHVKILVKFVSY